MAIQGPIALGHEGVFLHGCYVVGEVEPVRDFDRSTRETPVQAVDKETGELVWQVDVVDADPDARDKTVRVKITAPVKPVPPDTAPGVPFRPVEFDQGQAEVLQRRRVVGVEAQRFLESGNRFLAAAHLTERRAHVDLGSDQPGVEA